MTNSNDELRALVAKWRARVGTTRTEYDSGREIAYEQAADELEAALAGQEGCEFSKRTLYDHRDAVYRSAELAGPKLYWALSRLLEAVEERRDQCGIESLTISDAHNALLAATPPTATKENEHGTE